MPDPSTSAPPAVTPGWKTSEFWKGVAAMALSALFASGLITSSWSLALAGIAASWLTSMGYTVSRTLVKQAALASLLALSGCATLKADAAIAGPAVLDCTKLEAPKLELQLIALGGDIAAYVIAHTPINWDALVDQALADASDVKVCAIAKYKAARDATMPSEARSLAPDALAGAVTKMAAARRVSSIRV